jgi:NADH:ubiquinone oxidoreductase subunit C
VSEANSIELKADAFLKKIKQLKLDRLIAISAIDVGSNFDLLYHFSHKNEIVEIKVILAKTKPIIDSIIDLYPSSQLYERETHDFFGIEFIGNPNLHDKLFLPDNWNEEPPLINKNA